MPPHSTERQTPPSRCVIIGGGLAGLAAAAALVSHKVPVVVLESRNRWGGRASSFLDSATQTYVDNCQHVSMGCCTNLAHFLRITGLEGALRRERTLYFIGRDGKTNRFAASNFPCPFHLAGAFRRLSYLSWRDKLSIALGLKALAGEQRTGLENQSFAQWLGEHQQTPGAISGFWHVVLVSALSETLDRIAVPYARKVFVDGFLKHRDGWCVDIPIVPLETLYGRRLVDWFAAQGAELTLQAGVEQLEMTESRVSAAVMRDGTRVPGDDFILAVPHHRAADLLPEPLAAHPSVKAFTALESAPISSLHLWLDRPITDLPHAVLVDRLSQWLFNRSKISEVSPAEPSEGGATEGHYYQVVISASRNLGGLSQDEVQRQVLDELGEIWPAAREAQVLHRRLVTEHKAVISVTPGAEKLRPAQQSPVENLQWAGDWTRTGWPGTMEGAVRSGYLAAENILRRRGQITTLVQPDLPTAFWSRWLWGLEK